MFNRVLQLFILPDEVRERAPVIGPLLNTVLVALAIVAAPAAILISAAGGEPFFNLLNLLGLGTSVLVLGLWLLFRNGQITVTFWALLFLLLGIVTAAALSYEGINSSGVVAYALVIAGAGVLLQERLAIQVATVLSIALAAILFFLEQGGVVTYTPNSAQYSDLFTLVAVFILLGWLLGYSVAYLNRAREQVEESERALAQANQQLESMNAVLEARVAARTRALSLSADLSRRLSTILDQQQLIREVVHQLQRTFNYYHVHIYLLDKNRNLLVMAGGTGEAGRRMLERGHTIEVGKGLVGQAASSNLPVLVPDVSAEPGWLPNRLLPETKSEVAIPVSRAEEVLAVLDVQQNVREGLTEEDVDLLQSVANQVAVALQNSRLFEQVRQQAEQEGQIAAISERIQQTRTVEEAMQVAVRELGRALNGQPAQVQLRTGGD